MVYIKKSTNDWQRYVCCNVSQCKNKLLILYKVFIGLILLIDIEKYLIMVTYVSACVLLSLKMKMWNCYISMARPHISMWRLWLFMPLAAPITGVPKRKFWRTNMSYFKDCSNYKNFPVHVDLTIYICMIVWHKFQQKVNFDKITFFQCKIAPL